MQHAEDYDSVEPHAEFTVRSRLLSIQRWRPTWRRIDIRTKVAAGELIISLDIDPFRSFGMNTVRVDSKSVEPCAEHEGSIRCFQKIVYLADAEELTVTVDLEEILAANASLTPAK